MTAEVPGATGPTGQVLAALRRCAAVAARSEERYADLDAEAGDGDFGPVLSLAWRRALAELEQQEPTTPAAALRAAAAGLAGAGGSTGPLWGTAFLRAGAALPDEGLSAASVADALDAAATGISERGGAEEGDKTLLDALLPAARALRDAVRDAGGADGTSAADLAQVVAEAARQGAEDTRELTARRGRATYQGEQSAGSIDPGAVAVADMAEALAALLRGEGDEDADGGAPGGDQTDEDDETRRPPVPRLVNDRGALVDEALDGLVAAAPQLLRLSHEPRFLHRADAPAGDRVALVSGGGAGHEPMHTGFVGPGMLDAACPGEVFASPSADAVLAAVRAVDGGAGVLLVVKNYTGDVMNFEMAAELAEAEGHGVETVLVADDVAVDGSTATVGRRGVTGTMVVEKVAGASAARGDGLAAVAAVARRAADRVRSMGLALRPVTLPSSAEPAFDLGGQVELGIGIHGEPGRERVDFESGDALVDQLVDALLDEVRQEADSAGSERLLVVTNGMGATPPLELAVAHRRAVARLQSEGFSVERSLVGSFVTSLDMAGVSLSVLPLDDELLELWDAPVACLGLSWERAPR